MTKKTEQNVETVEQAFNFPTVVIDGVAGITVLAKDQEEANEKLKKLLQNN